MTSITFAHVSKIFPDGTVAVDDLCLDIEGGEFVVLVGPSGSGKSTALRMVAGLEEVTDGEILLGDRIVNDVAPKDRDIAMIFQTYALYPHMTVYQNLEFSLRMRKIDARKRRLRVEEAAAMLELEPLLKRKPAELSGGQRQRVAMGRAIVREPNVFLMDEPLSNLDAKLRVQMRTEIAALHQRLGRTTIYVTHDQTEAMTMGDRVAVLRDGRLEQVASPRELYDRPANVFVAGFIGSPAMNLVRARLEPGADGGVQARFGTTVIQLPPSRVPREIDVPRDVILGIRPEHIEDAAFVPSANGAAVEVTAVRAEPLGSEVILHFDNGSRQPTASAGVRALLADVGEEVADGQGASPADSTLLTARINPRSHVRDGERLKLCFEADRFYFFDPTSERNLLT